jgi:hypothetical protein
MGIGWAKRRYYTVLSRAKNVWTGHETVAHSAFVEGLRIQNYSGLLILCFGGRSTQLAGVRNEMGDCTNPSLLTVDLLHHDPFAAH